LKSTPFIEWLEGKKKTLFCPGIPGAGKTMITSIVVNHLKTSFPDDKTGTAFLYCVYKRQDNQKVGNLLASLLGQLAVQQSMVPKSIRELYDKHRKGEKPRLSQDEIHEELCSIIKTYSRTFIVIDALDECKTDSIYNELLSEIYKLQEGSDTRLMVTFRPSVVLERPSGVTELEIRAHKGDISAVECLTYVVSFGTTTNCSVKSRLISWL
jgi:Cdc6-like AAA superfamily ATPase